MFNSGMLSVMFWIEIALFAVPMVMLMRAKDRAKFATIFKASMLIMLAGALYRFDTYIVAYNPGENWSYFPTTLELLITLGVDRLRDLPLHLHRQTVPDPERHPRRRDGSLERGA